MILDDYDPDRPWNKLGKPVYRLYQPSTGAIWDETTDLAYLEAIQEREAENYNLLIIEIEVNDFWRLFKISQRMKRLRGLQ